MPPETRLNVGDTAPVFTLIDADGNAAKLSAYASRKVIVYFSPSTTTPRYAVHAHHFQDSLARLNDAGLDVLGIYPDDPGALAEFRAEQDLTFPLLSDADFEVSSRWGVIGTKRMYRTVVEYVTCSTFVVDEKGSIEFARYNVKVGHMAAAIYKIIAAQNAWPQAWTEPRLDYASEQEI